MSSAGTNIDAVIDSKIVKLLRAIMVAGFIPCTLAGGGMLGSINNRLERLETTTNLVLPLVYPRTEAQQAFNTVNARIDGTAGRVEDLADTEKSTMHRVSALEEVRQRGLH